MGLCLQVSFCLRSLGGSVCYFFYLIVTLPFLFTHYLTLSLSWSECVVYVCMCILTKCMHTTQHTYMHTHLHTHTIHFHIIGYYIHLQIENVDLIKKFTSCFFVSCFLCLFPCFLFLFVRFCYSNFFLTFSIVPVPKHFSICSFYSVIFCFVCQLAFLFILTTSI